MKADLETGLKDLKVRKKTLSMSVKALSSVGTKFDMATAEGVKIRYTVLTNEVGTETVRVGAKVDSGSTTGNGLPESPGDKPVNIPETVTYDGVTYTVVEIGNAALASGGIKSLTLPSTLKTIDQGALKDNAFTTLTIPEGVTRIGDMALTNCKSLTVVKFPHTITSLGAALFQYCSKLTTVYFPVKFGTVSFVKDDPTRNNIPFFGLDSNYSAVIFENREQWLDWRNANGIIGKSKEYSDYLTTYEIDASFYDKDLHKLDIPSVKKLYGRTAKFVKDSATDTWTAGGICSDVPAFPTGLGYTVNFWGINDLGISAVNSSKNVVESTAGGGAGLGQGAQMIDGKFVAVEAQFTPTVTGVDKTFDNEATGIKLSSNRTIGADYFHEWNRYGAFYLNDGTNDAGDYILNFPFEMGMEEKTATAGFKNVADSGTYTWSVELYNKETIPNPSMGGILWLSHPRTTSPVSSVTVAIKAAAISIKPTVADDTLTWSDTAALPAIIPTTGDTEGTYTWDAGQTVTEGMKSYNYTFVPDNVSAEDKNGATVLNYTAAKETGSIQLTYAKATKYTVIFKGKDGQLLDTQLVEENMGATAPTPPVVPGFDFVGWDKPFDKITGDLTVTAKYKATEVAAMFTVNFMDDGKIIKSELVEYGKKATAPTAPSKEGFDFIGWDKPFDNITQSIAVNALYKAKTFSVAFTVDGKIIKNQQVEYGKNATAPTAPSKEGYIFIGWDKSFNKVTENLTVNGRYKVKTFLVTFIADGRIIKEQLVEYGERATAPASPYKKGYDFIGWDKSFDAVTSNMTVRAHFMQQAEAEPTPPVVSDEKEQPTTDKKSPAKSPEQGPQRKNIVTNKKTGSTVETINHRKVFETDTKVVVVDAKKEEKKLAEQKLDNIIKIFDVILEENGVKVEKTFDDSLRISIDAKEFSKYKSMKMFVKQDDGTYKELPMKVEDGQIIFECDALDTYVLTGVKDAFPWWIVICGIIVLGGIIIILAKKKRKTEE